jgi:hypothetical protein
VVLRGIRGLSRVEVAVRHSGSCCLIARRKPPSCRSEQYISAPRELWCPSSSSITTLTTSIIVSIHLHGDIVAAHHIVKVSTVHQSAEGGCIYDSLFRGWKGVPSLRRRKHTTRVGTLGLLNVHALPPSWLSQMMQFARSFRRSTSPKTLSHQCLNGSFSIGNPPA